MRTPISTYRLQVGSIGVAEASAYAPYLAALGISDAYVSPVLRAGSDHGYDVLDPSVADDRVGGDAGFADLARRLADEGLGVLLDIVPNHMAVSPENPWWWDVLEHGRASRFATFFDITWEPPEAPELSGRLVLPVLGNSFGQEVRSSITIGVDDTRPALVARYHDRTFPIDPATYGAVEAWAEESALRGLWSAASRVPWRDGAQADERSQATAGVRTALHRIVDDPAARSALVSALGLLNGSGESAVAARRRLLADQAYRLTFWRTGRQRLNYRRFFEIDDLVGVRVEHPDVFDAVHQRILEMVERGQVSALRVDHVDGLADPEGYLRRLRDATDRRSQGRPPPVYVEKILAHDEEVPQTWPVAGTTGYEFMVTVNGLHLDVDGVDRLRRTYARFTGDTRTFSDIAGASKRGAILEFFPAELRRLARRLAVVAEVERRDVTEAALLDVVVEITVAMPRYRTYLAPGHVSAEDRVVVKTVTQAALDAGCDPEAVKITRDVLLHDVDQPGAAEWVVAWQQFTPAVAAKGVEDTALYRYHAHEALNVVGGDPDVVPSDPVGCFHRYCEERAGRPSRAGLNATSTHDTKRSEDVRCRIDVLSELSHSWPRLLRRFSRLTAVHRRDLGDRVAPDRVDESLVYQVLLGAWPLSGDELPEFRDRLAAYLVKAARESKRHTSWLDPDESYEAALTNFAAGLFEDQEFRAAFEPLQRKVASAGAVNSLAEVVCKVAAPGAPDVYQGTELWDLSLVDPDNRRRVDLDHRVRLLAQLDAEEREAGGERLARRLLGEWHDGAVKLFVLSRAMRARRERPEIFVTGRYSPLRASGRRSDHVVAFARAASDGATAVTVVPRLVARWTGPGRLPVGRWWATTAVELPEDGPTEWVDALTGRRVRSVDGRIALADLLRNLPVAIALSE